MESNQIYNLKLHESIVLKDDDSHTTVLRVPGGWIYTLRLVLKAKIKDEDAVPGDKPRVIQQLFSTSTFVPLSGEFNA